MYRALTELTIVVHLAFIVFVIAGGILARQRRWLVPVHLTAIAWAVYAELSSGVVCPLTTVENFFAVRAGISSYSEDFVAHHLAPLIYQDGLPQKWQDVVVVGVLVFNVLVYMSLLWRRSKGANQNV